MWAQSEPVILDHTRSQITSEFDKGEEEDGCQRLHILYVPVSIVHNWIPINALMAKWHMSCYNWFRAVTTPLGHHVNWFFVSQGCLKVTITLRWLGTVEGGSYLLVPELVSIWVSSGSQPILEWQGKIWGGKPIFSIGIESPLWYYGFGNPGTPTLK